MSVLILIAFFALGWQSCLMWTGYQMQRAGMKNVQIGFGPLLVAAVLLGVFFALG